MKRTKTTKQIKKERERQKWESYNNTIQHNPLPIRGQINNTKVFVSIESNSNFINCKGGYFNRGKYKGIPVKDVKKHYLKWVLENISLNQSELKLLRKYQY